MTASMEEGLATAMFTALPNWVGCRGPWPVPSPPRYPLATAYPEIKEERLRRKYTKYKVVFVDGGGGGGG